ncbi:chemotaxis protein CheW [Syntrophotalea acetylenivorans]|uniref:Chemotaxis protein CheW n=1 Tax=Syntrophotalea acetylenivorans TaxID=1842532 RepID=A0A1L3GPG4_9BACT|nr:chemotaxis protein CheW [Syntrophotalea acetylenivorans]APG27770.1 chemotaxis protein CheW [Syntrophotalea acetylenivorans]
MENRSNLAVEDSAALDGMEDSQEGRYLTFRLGSEDYGIAICHVVEIVGLQKITAVPNQPPFMKGVINLRGKIIPLMDGRIRFGLGEEAYDDRTCVIVTDVEGRITGLIVDRVNEVLEIPAEQVEPPAAANGGGPESYVCGLGKVGDSVKVLLDVKPLFNC